MADNFRNCFAVKRDFRPDLQYCEDYEESLKLSKTIEDHHDKGLTLKIGLYPSFVNCFDFSIFSISYPFS